MRKTITALAAVALAASGCVNPLEAEVVSLRNEVGRLNQVIQKERESVKNLSRLYLNTDRAYSTILDGLNNGDFEFIQSVKEKGPDGKEFSRVRIRYHDHFFDILDMNQDSQFNEGDVVRRGYMAAPSGLNAAEFQHGWFNECKSALFQHVLRHYNPGRAAYFKKNQAKNHPASQRNYSGGKK